MRRRGVLSVVIALCGAVAATFVLGRESGETAPRRGSSRPEPARAPASPEAGENPWMPRDAGVLRLRELDWLAAGGGPVPELNQVQIEQDLGLLRETLGGHGMVLFAAGAQAPTVQVLDEEASTDTIALALADLFAPRAGRDASYRAPAIPVDGGATANTVSTALRRAVSGGDTPLLVYLAGHGSQGETVAQNTIDLWAQSALTVADLAEVLDDAKRPVHLVVTTCFSGGFGELAFSHATVESGPARGTRCGLFATTWDLEASGCDPDPDRARQQGYGLHFLNALRGRDRDGHPVPHAELDLDGDGSISLLEAHTRVRIASEAADVPTTTSERWLRQMAPDSQADDEVTLVEDEALIEAMAQKLGLRGSERAAFGHLQRIEASIEEVTRRLQAAQRDEDDAYRNAAAHLLARWPVLDDPWHPHFAATLTKARADIEAHLQSSPSFAAYIDAREVVDRLNNEVAELRREAAPYERLARALDNRRLAARLRARGGEAWKVYERLLACERHVPAVTEIDATASGP